MYDKKFAGSKQFLICLTSIYTCIILGDFQIFVLKTNRNTHYGQQPSCWVLIVDLIVVT